VNLGGVDPQHTDTKAAAAVVPDIEGVPVDHT
jgi:hypothetical protein